MYIEFDRDPKINVVELIRARREKLASDNQVLIVEIEASEYMAMKQKIKDLEMQNALLRSQVKVLKT